MAVPLTFSVFAIIAVVLTLSNGEVKVVPDVSTLLVKEGTSQTLKCVTTNPKSLEWEWPNQARATGVTYAGSFGEKDGATQQVSVLTIGNVSQVNAGEYICKQTVDENVFSQEITLIPVTETKSEPTYHFGNQSAVLSCSISVPGKTVESVTWMKGDKPVSELDGGRFTVEADNSLVIGTPEREDIGTYTASIKMSQVETSYKCQVDLKEEELHISATKVEPTFYHGNETATLACHINSGGRKITKTEWYKDGEKVSDLTEHQRFEVGKNNTLTITDTDRGDAGLYTLKFTMEHLEEPYNCDVMYKAGPFVLDFKKSKNLIEDDKMELQCQVKGYPKAEVTWYKDGAVLNVSDSAGTGEPRIQLSPVNGYLNGKLTIRDVAFSDAGEYSCEAYSSYFNQSDVKIITVRVKDKLAALWPFLGIVCEVIVLCTIIFIYEKRRNKKAEQEENNAQEAEPSMEKKDGLRHRNTPGNPGA